MKIFKIIQHPLIKNVAIIAIIYLALFSNKQDPNSLGNRMSSDNLKKDFNEVTQKASFIAKNIEEAKQYHEEAQEKQRLAKALIATFKTKDIELGVGDVVVCGLVASISFSIFTSGNKEIYRSLEDVVIGAQSNLLLEEKVLGMKVGGVRIVDVPKNFINDDEKLQSFLVDIKEDLQYHIKLERFYKSDNLNLSCK